MPHPCKVLRVCAKQRGTRLASIFAISMRPRQDTTLRLFELGVMHCVPAAHFTLIDPAEDCRTQSSPPPSRGRLGGEWVTCEPFAETHPLPNPPLEWEGTTNHGRINNEQEVSVKITNRCNSDSCKIQTHSRPGNPWPGQTWQSNLDHIRAKATCMHHFSVPL